MKTTLHDAIMRIPFDTTESLDYKKGHRDARHSAAELAVADLAAKVELWGYWWEPKDPNCNWLHAGKSNNTGPHPDYNVTTLYAAPRSEAP